jgi:hypothetical protein
MDDTRIRKKKIVTYNPERNQNRTPAVKTKASASISILFGEDETDHA